MDAIKALLAQVQKFWAGKDSRFKRTVLVVAAVALVAIVLASVLFSQVQYATLYSGLDSTDSAAVLAALKTQKITYKVDGSTILVPADQADSLRMSLANEVKSGINLDILKQGQGLGMAESDKQDYRKYQIQYDMQSAIKTLDGIKDATVAITMPTQSVTVIESNQQEATAGVILTLQPGIELSASQIGAIKSYVQKNVPGLKMENISLMDNNMQNLDATDSTDDLDAPKDQYALQNSVEARLRKQLMSLLMPVFGIGKVEAQVNCVLDFDDKTTDSTTYTPVVNNKDGVIVSYDKLKEQIVNGGGTTTGQTGTATNTGTTTYPSVSSTNGTYLKTEDKVNLEVNTINEHLKKAKGSIKNLSVAVVIDNTNLKQDLTNNIKSLVANAVGATTDNVSVEYLPMTGSQALTDTLAQTGRNQAAAVQNQQTRIYVIVGAVALVVLAGMLLLFMSNRARYRAEHPQLVPAMAGAGMGSLDEPMMEMEDEGEGEDMPSIQIVKDSETKAQIGKLIDTNPELVANLLRSWLADEQE